MNAEATARRLLTPHRTHVEGTVLSMLALAGLARHGYVETSAQLAAACIFTVAVYWLANVYAELLSRDASALSGARSVLHAAGGIARSEGRMFIPVVALNLLVLVLRIAGASIETAILVMLAAGCAALFSWGAVAARRAGSSHVASLALGLVGAFIGLLVIAGKLLLH